MVEVGATELCAATPQLRGFERQVICCCPQTCPPAARGTASAESVIKVEQGRGYIAATSRKTGDEGRSVGSIMLDASFSPVRRVSYSVESARVEQRTDLDKLIMDIETNGAIEPEEAVRYAARASSARDSASYVPPSANQGEGELGWRRVHRRAVRRAMSHESARAYVDTSVLNARHASHLPSRSPKAAESIAMARSR